MPAGIVAKAAPTQRRSTMGSIENLAGVFFDAANGIINSVLGGATGSLEVVQGSLGGE